MRSNARAVSSTLQLLAVGIGVPVALSMRLMKEPLPLQPLDAAIAVAIVVWLLLAKALISRSDAVDSRTVNALSPTNRLVDQSVFGVGFTTRDCDNTDGGLQHISAVREITADQLPPIMAPARTDRADRIDGLDQPVRSIPVLPEEEAMPEILATEEYTVVRGDTFWSIADAIFDDGRQWTVLHDINFGREVAPGVLLDDGDELCIGWSILIPLLPEIVEEVEVGHGDSA